MSDPRPDPPAGELAGDETDGPAVDATAVECLRYAVAEDERLLPGDTIDGLTVIRYVGAGGMGEVYEAEQGGGLNRRVIVKVRRGLGSEAERAEFVREGEVQAAAGLHHQGILPVLAAGREGDQAFLVLPFIRGASVKELLPVLRGAIEAGREPDVSALVAAIADDKDRDVARPWLMYAPPAAPLPRSDEAPASPLPLTPRYCRWVVERMVEAARAIDSAHRAGVLHLDISPGNLLVEAGTDQVKVCDFGLGLRFVPREGGGEEPVPCERKGTPGYTAPEVLAAARADRRSDVYGLGACLFELLTLHKPGRDGAAAAPGDLLAVARTALAANPADRYPTAGALADDLQRWLDGRVPTVRNRRRDHLRAAALWVRRNWQCALTGAMVLAALLAWLGYALATAAQERRRADEVQKQREYEQALTAALSKLHDKPLRAGWPREVQRQLGALRQLRPDADLRDHAAATLGGLDAVPVYEDHVPAANNRPSGLADVVYSPDGTRLVASGWGDGYWPYGPTVLWDGNAANKLVASRRHSFGPVAYPDADSPLQLILPLKEQQSLTLWNVATDAVLLDIPLPGPPDTNRSYSAALSPDARFAAMSYTPLTKAGAKPAPPITTLWRIDRKPGAVAEKVGEWPVASTALAFSPNSKLLATGSESGEVTVRVAESGKEVLSFVEGHLPVTGLGFGKNYRRPGGERPGPANPAAGWLLGVGSKGGGLSVWNLRGTSAARMNSFHGSEHAVYAIAFSPDGTLLISGGRTFSFAWDVSTARPLLRFQSSDGAYRWYTKGVAIHPEGNRVAFGTGAPAGTGGALDVFRLDDGQGVRTYRGLSGVVEKVWLSPTGKWVAALAQNWQLGVWDRATGRVAYVWDVPAGWIADNSAVAFDENDTQVLLASGEHATRWNLATGEQTGSWKLPLGLNDCLVSRPGKPPLLVRRDRETAFRSLLARELLPNGQMKNGYTIPDLADGKGNITVETTQMTDDGRLLLVLQQVNGGPRALLFSGVTGDPIPLDGPGFPPRRAGVWLSQTGKVMVVDDAAGFDAQMHLLRLPEQTRFTVHPGQLHRVDDAGRLGVTTARYGEGPLSKTMVHGIMLMRVGEARPIVTFDPGYYPASNGYGISPDGHFIYWGRNDGTVCLADVNRCLEQLLPFGTR